MISLTSAVLTLATLAAIPGARGILGSNLGYTRIVIAALVLHATLWACRRFAVPGGTAWGIAAFVVVVGTLGSWGAVGHETGLALDAIRSRPIDGSLVPESAEVVAGRMTLALLVVGLCVLLADQAAFRVKGTFLALAPSFALVLVGSVRSEPQDPALDFWAYILICVAFLVIHHQFTAEPVAGSGTRPLTASTAAALVTPTSVLALAAVTSAFVLAPLVPGYGRAAIVESDNRFGFGQRSGSGDGDTVSLSPIVDIRPNLVERSSTLAFTVDSFSSPGYWRITSLDRFNGEEWTASNDTDAFPADVPFPTNATVVRQSIRIAALRSDWLPAAYRAQSVEGPATIDRDTHSVRPTATIEGLEYRVTSLVSAPTPDRLALSPPVQASSRAATRYLALPRSLSSRVTAEARRVTAAVEPDGPYAVARRLQDYFRTTYTYDLDVGPGNGSDALEDFVLTTRRGYCEQFAAAYAVMARSLGIPARVAVGFTSGDLRDDGLFHVQGLNAHAWPEVYLQGFGWMAFEPTPGRGMPGAEGYTGVPAAQASPLRPDGGPQTATTEPGSTATTPTTIGPGTSVPTTVAGAAGSSTTVRGASPTTTRSGAVAGTEDDDSRPLLLLVTVGVVLATAFAARGRLARRRRPWHHHRDDRDRVLAAWSSAADSLAVSGLGRRPAETFLDHATRAAGDERLPAEVGERVLVLAGTAGTAAYGTADLPADDVAACEDAARAIKAAVRDVAPLRRRLAAAILPRRG